MSPDVLTFTSGAVEGVAVGGGGGGGGSGRLVISGMKCWRGWAVGTSTWVTLRIIQGTCVCVLSRFSSVRLFVTL